MNTLRVAQTATMTTRKILLINSEPHVREVMQACLNHLAGWHVLSTGSPTEGLQQAMLDPPDAIIFDLSTFGMNFFAFLKLLRAQSITQDIPVILMATGAKWLNLEPLQQFQLAGVIDYSINPVSFPQRISELLHWDDTFPAPESSDPDTNPD